MMPLTITLLFILTMAGMALVPEAVVPIMVWPLLLGLGNITWILLRSFRQRAFDDENMAPLLTAVFSLTLAIAFPFEHPRRGVSFLLAFITTFLTGVIWSAWWATKESKKPSDHSKQ